MLRQNGLTKVIFMCVSDHRFFLNTYFYKIGSDVSSEGFYGL
jgi:hypothetical protein